MPRKPRIDYPGAWHHVMNRGRNKEPVFVDDDDCQLFVDHFAAATRAHRVEVHSYCLMTNHYHALVRSTEAELSAAMQLLGSRYTLDFNQRHRLDGALFKGRFFSKLIEDESYLAEATRYIPNNPVKAGLVARPEQYRWSSYSYTIGLEPAPSFLNVSATTDLLFNRDVEAFDTFVRGSDSPRAELFAHAIESRDPRHLLSVSIRHIEEALHRFEAMAMASSVNKSVVPPVTELVCEAFDLPLHGVLCPNNARAQTARLLLLTLLSRQPVAQLRDLPSVFGLRSKKSAQSTVRRFEQTVVVADPNVRALLQRGLVMFDIAA